VSLAELDFARVQAVSFDVGGTLLTPHPSVGAVYAEILLRHQVELAPSVIETRFRQAFSLLRAHPRAVINEATELAFWREMALRSVSPECPAALFPNFFAELWAEFAQARRWRPLPGAGELIGNLGGRTAAVFSNWDARLHRVLAELGWARHFRGVFVSSEIGAEKPDPRAFRAVEKALNLSPKNILHVGDSLEQDYLAAQAAGWQAVLVAPGPPAPLPSAAYVTRLDDLLPSLA